MHTGVKKIHYLLVLHRNPKHLPLRVTDTIVLDMFPPVVKDPSLLLLHLTSYVLSSFLLLFRGVVVYTSRIPHLEFFRQSNSF